MKKRIHSSRAPGLFPLRAPGKAGAAACRGKLQSWSLYWGNNVGNTLDLSVEKGRIWQTFLQKYHKLEIYAMAVHHLDIFRYLFGDPEKITAVCRTDPRTKLSIPTALYSIPISTKTDLWLPAGRCVGMAGGAV